MEKTFFKARDCFNFQFSKFKFKVLQTKKRVKFLWMSKLLNL